MRPRVGHIQFLNCLPLYYGLVRHNVLLDIELTKGTPTELNRHLLSGKLDIGPISSLEFARHSQELLLLPHLTVSSNGEVKSIVLVSKVPVEELQGKPVALTSTSATSQGLLQIILADKYGLEPNYFVSPPDLGRMLLEAEGALLIGDDALRVSYQRIGLYVYDLGREWKDLTGQMMVYAVWGVRREFAAHSPGLVKLVYQGFLQSLKYSRDHAAEIAADAARWEPFSEDFLRDYFLNLRFGFSPKYQEGLLEFFRRAKRHGFLEKVPKLEFVEVEK